MSCQVSYNKGHNVAIFDVDKNEIQFANVFGDKIHVRSTVRIPFKFDDSQVQVPRKNYLSQRSWKNSSGVRVTVTVKSSDQNVPIINPLRGVMTRYASSDQFALIFQGDFIILLDLKVEK
jgi:hypothetical protein